jgi:uncharacterized protein (TIGR01777 family)
LRVAVTGSSGLIGTPLRARLLAEGHEVVRVVRRPVAEGEPALRWDPLAGTIDTAGLAGVDGVVNLAGPGIGDKRWTEERKRELVESRTHGTALLASTLAALEPQPSVLVSGSAIGYYGERGDEVLTESSGPGDDPLARLCVDWEAATAPAADAGIRVATIRTGIVLTTAGGALPKLLPLFKLGLGGKMGSGRQWWSWITLRDEVDAIVWLLTHDLAGPVNLTAPAPVTNAELTKALGAQLHRPTVLTVPKFGPGLVVGRELAQALLFTSQRVQPSALIAAGFAFSDPELPAALASIL